MARHILFIPWTLASGETPHLRDACNMWVTNSRNQHLKHNYPYEIVTSGDGTDLSTLPWFSEIYVMGHCAAGSHVMGSGAANQTLLKYDAIADRLVAHGLRKTWCGSVKIFACDSGMCTLGRQSMAAKFAQHMRFTKGFHLISYVGYYGAVDMIAKKQHRDDHHKHKRATRFAGTPFQTELKTKWCKVFF